MGLSKEENARRDNDEHVKWITEHITTMGKEKDFVFISYKSDDWEVALHDIVYELMTTHGLRVYFDGSFKKHNSLWTEQFPKNMESSYCKAVLAFIDEKYMTSYATLMELLHSQMPEAGLGMKQGKLPVVPVNLYGTAKFTGNGDADTGLGRDMDDEGEPNPNASAEQKIFDTAFKNAKKKKLIPNKNSLYSKEKPFTKMRCYEIANELIGSLKVNKNNYIPDTDSLKKFCEDLAASIKDAVGGDSVFGEPIPVPGPDKNDDKGKKDPAIISWKEFDALVKAFSYKGKAYNVSDARQAYCAIIDAAKQDNSSLDVENIIEGKMPCYVKLTDGSELDMIKGKYGKILSDIPTIKDAVILYGESLPDAAKAKDYEVLERTTTDTDDTNTDDTNTPPLGWFCDDIGSFGRYFTELFKQHKENWEKSGLPGKTPTINMDIKLHLNVDVLEHHTISGYKWKSIFTEAMNYFYQISGNAYYDHAMAFYNRPGLKEPLVINSEIYETKIQDKGRYDSVQDGTYYFLNSYGATKLIGAMINQINTYFAYLREKQIDKDADLSRVMVEYKILEPQLRQMMAQIRENTGSTPKSGGTNTRKPMPADLTAFEEESLTEFAYRYKKIFARYSDEWKANNTGNTPSIPFSNIRIHMPEDVVKTQEISADNWKPLFNNIMEEFYQSSEGKYFEHRGGREMGKGNKNPAVIDKEYYDTKDIARKRYQSVANGAYYFYNSYGADILIDKMRDEIMMYIDFTNNNKGTESGLDEVMISYCLPNGSFAEMFA